MSTFIVIFGHGIFCVGKSPNQTSGHKRAVSLGITDGHLNVLQGFVWVCIG